MRQNHIVSNSALGYWFSVRQEFSKSEAKSIACNAYNFVR